MSDREELKWHAEILAEGMLISEVAAYQRIGKMTLGLLAELEAAEANFENSRKMSQFKGRQIMKLELERDRLREALERIASYAADCGSEHMPCDVAEVGRVARRGLGGEE